ncbi:MAG: M20/M25/M40 family metallo-hydrolase [Planctomycetota bacterium]
MLITLLAISCTSITGPDEPLAKDVTALVDADRCKASVVKLAGFGSRHSLSETDSETRGTGAARRWLKSELEVFAKASDGRLKVEFEEFDAPKLPRLPNGARLVNVVATLPGNMPEASRRVVYVVGHYDSINGTMGDPKGDAPGANDDASGTAVVLECCRVLAGRKLDATVVFLCTAAEEQGLVGAKYHADTLATKKLYDQVFVLNNDIVGDPSIPFGVPAPGSPPTTTTDSGAFVRLFSEGIPKNASAEELARIRTQGAESDSPSRQLARFVAAVAQREGMAFKPRMIFRQDRFLRGGDHSAFNDAGFAGVRFTVPGEDYSRQHATVIDKEGKPYGDLPEFVSGEYIAGVARLNAASIVHLANAPTPPANTVMLTRALTQTATLRWDRPPEPDVAGYEIMIRETTAPDWNILQRIEGTADKTSTITLALSKDNYFFGVRAFDKDGYRSPVSFCWASKD